jgi:hypothetical protein
VAALNDMVNSETGAIAFLLRFGSDVETYMKLPSKLPPAEFTSKYVELLDENLKLVHPRRISARKSQETWFCTYHLGKTI